MYCELPTHRQNKDEMLALLKALAWSDARIAASLLLKRSIDLDMLDGYCHRERMGPYVYASIKKLNLDALFPRRVLRALEGQYREQQQKSKALAETLNAIHGEFGRARIDHMLLKGFHLAQTYWGGTDKRFIWDLDILVKPEDLPAVFSALSNCGFERNRNILRLFSLFRLMTHAIGCERVDGLSLDLHWTFRTLPGARLDHDAVWERGETFRLFGGNYRAPCAEHLLLLIVLGIAHDIVRCKCRLRGLWDVYLLLRAHPEFDWPVFFVNREKDGFIGIAVEILWIIIWRLDCRDEFPALVKMLEESFWARRPADTRLASLLRAKPGRSYWNLGWYARLQPVSQRRFLLWWIWTAPFRYLLIK